MDSEYYKNLTKEIEKKIDKKRSFIKKTIFLILFITIFSIFRHNNTESWIEDLFIAFFFSFYPGFLLWMIWDFNWILKFSNEYHKLSQELENNNVIIKKLEEEAEKEREKIREEINKEGLKKLQELKNIYEILYNKRISEEYTDEYSKFFEIVNDLSNNNYYFNLDTRYGDLELLQKYSNGLKERMVNYSSNVKTDTNKQKNIEENDSKNDPNITNEETKIKLTTIENFKVSNKTKLKYTNDDWRTGGKIKIDFLKRNQQNIELGLKGELIVLKWEKDNLTQNGLTDLSEKVRHVSQELGDNAGFDILSYDFNGDEKFIEVKTTKKDAGSQFYFSKNELTFIKNNQNYYLYRLSLENEDEAELTVINKNDFLDKFQIIPHQYIVKLKE